MIRSVTVPSGNEDASNLEPNSDSFTNSAAKIVSLFFQASNLPTLSDSSSDSTHINPSIPEVKIQVINQVKVELRTKWAGAEYMSNQTILYKESTR